MAVQAIQLGPAKWRRAVGTERNGRYEGPLPIEGPITSYYGAYEAWRKRFSALQLDGTYKYIDVGPHKGVDIAADRGTPIRAPASGKVKLVGQKNPNPAYANYMWLEHEIKGRKSWTRYLHLQFPPTLKVGDYVKRGDVIGLVGSTGKSTGPHLHWELYLSELYGNRADRVNALNYVVKELEIHRMPRSKLIKAIFPLLWKGEYKAGVNEDYQGTVEFEFPV